MDDPAKQMIIFFIFILINAILYGFGEAIRQVNYNELERKKEDGSKTAGKVIKIIDNPKKLILTIHVVTISMAVVVGHYQVERYKDVVENFLAEKFALYLTDAFILFLSYLAVGFYLIMLMIAFGVIVPKYLGKKHSMGWSMGLVKIINALMTILTPVTGIINFLAELVLRIIGIDPKDTDDNVTEEEIVSIVNEGHEQGVLMASEAEMINNIIELDEKIAADIMIHRKSIIAIDGDSTLKEAAEFILNEGISRFPVYKDNIDNIIGIMHLRDAMKFYYNSELQNTKINQIDNLIRKADFIPETRNIDRLFKEMQSNKTHMVIVVDEYGQTAGLIAMEDILEEIVGNILDEYDEEENNIVKEEENIYLIKGSTTLEELEDRFGLKFEDEEYDTINGYLIAELDRIPEDDDKPVVDIEGNTFEVLSIKNKMIDSIRMTLKPQEQNESEAEE